MILVNRCYSETTPESAEEGEYSDSGFIIEDEPFTFRELVRLLKYHHSEPSNSPASGDIGEWYGTGYYTDDYSSGTEREETVHYSRANPARNAKYWRWAAIAAGIVRPTLTKV